MSSDSLPPHDRQSRDRAYADPYRPLPPPEVPATGSAHPGHTDLAPEEEPVTTGTLFLTIILLMIIGAIWAVMYSFLLHR